MRHKYFLFFITTCFIFTGCSKREGLNTEIYNIDFEQGFDTEQQMFISEIADSVEYIELKTPDGVVVTKIWDVKQFDDYLVIRAQNELFLFHKNGEFIRKVSALGQGSGEYSALCDVEFDLKKKELLILDVDKLLFYNLEGEFLRSKKNEYYTFQISISDSILWMGETILTSDSKYSAVATSLQGKGDTIAYIPNFLYGIIDDDKWGIGPAAHIRFFYHEKDYLYFNGDLSNDTVWRISGVSAEPYAFIDMGKYKMPVEFEIWYSSREKFMQNISTYWGVSSMVESDRYFFLFSHKRDYNWREYKKDDEKFLKRVVYDKETKKTFSVKDKNGMGFSDDILGGPPIWPRFASYDYYINYIETQELLEMVEDGEYLPSPPLKELLSRIDDYSNDLIILIHRKK